MRFRIELGTYLLGVEGLMESGLNPGNTPPVRVFQEAGGVFQRCVKVLLFCSTMI
jgi:hypothetical protein